MNVKLVLFSNICFDILKNNMVVDIDISINYKDNIHFNFLNNNTQSTLQNHLPFL